MRKLAIAAAFATALAAPAGAFEIDYPALFERFGDQVREVTESQRVLDLPGPVTVIAQAMQNGATKFTALDLSGYGPAGCGFDTVVNALAFGQACEGVLSPAQMDRLRGMAGKAAAFMSENGMAEGAAAASAILEAALAAASPLPCPGEGDAGADYADQIRGLASDAGAEALTQMLSRPRLPVCLAQVVPPAE